MWVDFQPLEIVLQYDPVAKTGYDWGKIGDYNYYQLLGPEADGMTIVK